MCSRAHITSKRRDPLREYGARGLQLVCQVLKEFFVENKKFRALAIYMLNSKSLHDLTRYLFYYPTDKEDAKFSLPTIHVPVECNLMRHWYLDKTPPRAKMLKTIQVSAQSVSQHQIIDLRPRGWMRLNTFTIMAVAWISPMR